jgi:DeoR family transcriptional regulator of aga operon
MIDVAQQVIILADSSKFGRKSFGKIADFSKIDVIISDDIPPAFLELFESMGIETIICKTNGNK